MIRIPWASSARLVAPSTVPATTASTSKSMTISEGRPWLVTQRVGLLTVAQATSVCPATVAIVRNGLEVSESPTGLSRPRGWLDATATVWRVGCKEL